MKRSNLAKRGIQRFGIISYFGGFPHRAWGRGQNKTCRRLRVLFRGDSGPKRNAWGRGQNVSYFGWLHRGATLLALGGFHSRARGRSTNEKCIGGCVSDFGWFSIPEPRATSREVRKT